MTRLETNIKILAKITEYAIMNPDQRFGQILRNTGAIIDHQELGYQGDMETKWVNHFNEEPESMLKRMETEEKKRGMQ